MLYFGIFDWLGKTVKTPKQVNSYSNKSCQFFLFLFFIIYYYIFFIFYFYFL